MTTASTVAEIRGKNNEKEARRPIPWDGGLFLFWSRATPLRTEWLLVAQAVRSTDADDLKRESIDA